MDAVIPPIPVKFGKNPFPEEKSNGPPKKEGHEQSKRNNSNARTRLFALVTYATDIDIMLALSLHSEQIRYSCYILHDRDRKDDGELKEQHYHIVIECYNPYRISAIRSWFAHIKDNKLQPVTTLVQPVIDRKEIIDYLTHENRKDKAQYSRDEVVNYSQALLIAKEKPRTDDDKALLILDDMIAGVPEYQLCRRYGREYIINARHYRDMVFNIIDDASLPEMDKEAKHQLYRKYNLIRRN